MGQDVYTGLAKIVADELDLDWDTLELEIAPHHPDFYSARGQSTGDSRTIRNWYQPLRKLGASVRQVMRSAAASIWQVNINECDTRDGFVIHGNSGKQLSYHSLASAAAGLALPVDPQLKPDTDLKLIGQPLARRDAKGKGDGSALFGADIRLPRQVYAAVSMPAAAEAFMTSFNREAALGSDGVIDAIELETGLAVVAHNWWQAHEALKLAEPVFSASPYEHVDDHFIEEELANRINDDGRVAVLVGDPDGALEIGQAIEASYSVPYLAHFCMEPMTATVSVEEDRVLAYAPTQSPQRCAQLVAKRTGRPIENIEMRNTFLGGGFGRKGLDLEVLAQATDLSMKMQRPVQVNWDRETDTRQDQLRPAARYQFHASLDGEGNISAVDIRVAAQSLRRQLFPRWYDPDGHELLEDLFVYSSPARRHRWCEVVLPVRVGYWRAVWHSSNPFAAESFIDELAFATDRDPVEYRLVHLATRPRTSAVLEAVARSAGWGRAMPAGSGLGVAVQEGWDSVCAQVAEVVVRDGEIKVPHIWAAVDCGKVISPDAVEAQISSSIVYALTAALHGRTSIQGGAIRESNFHDSPILGINEMPEIRIEIISSSADPGGVGELGVPACAPAVSNALFAATGHRARSLPLKQLPIGNTMESA